MSEQVMNKKERKIKKFDSIIHDYFSDNKVRHYKRLGNLSKIELLEFLIHINNPEFNTIEWIVDIKISLEENSLHKN